MSTVLDSDNEPLAQRIGKPSEGRYRGIRVHEILKPTDCGPTDAAFLADVGKVEPLTFAFGSEQGGGPRSFHFDGPLSFVELPGLFAQLYAGVLQHVFAESFRLLEFSRP